MGNKRDNKIIFVSILIVVVFVFSIIGYHQSMGDHFSLPGAVYSTLFFFILNNISPEEAVANSYLIIARYLAALMLGFGVYSLLYKQLHRAYTRLLIRYRYHNHVIVFSLRTVSTGFFADLLANNYKVILVDEQSDDAEFEKVRRDGVIVFRDGDHGTRLFDAVKLSRASACVVAFDDDSRNIELTLKVLKYLRGKGHRHSVRVLTHIAQPGNLEVIKDYVDITNADENFEFEVFNIFSAAAKKIYDHFPPHSYFTFDSPDEENAIAVIGHNQSAEDFLVENLILSHYHDGVSTKVYLVDKDADTHLHNFLYKYPFSREYIDIVPVRLLNNKFFANFNWSKELIEKLSKVKAAYFFGNEGSELINMSARFRQFLSGQSPSYLTAPIVICYPEDTGIMNLLDVERENSDTLNEVFRKQLNVNVVNMISDTCTSARLLEESEYIDMLSRVINYYYSIRYDFGRVLSERWQVTDATQITEAAAARLIAAADKQQELSEAEIESLVLTSVSGATAKSAAEVKALFSIKKWWDGLSYHKKSANRYAARHLSVKINVMKSMGCLPVNRENVLRAFDVIAPLEHKRWCAEKMVQNYRYGRLPTDRIAKNNAKEILKIHDQLIPYDKLTQQEKEKDLDVFLLMPLLNSLKAEIKK